MPVHRTRRRGAGFTLLELVVVLAILTIASGALIASAWPGRSTDAEGEARRLAALLELALTEARASGRSIAWAPEPRGYAFLQRVEGGWTAFPESSPLRRRELAAGVTLAGEQVVLAPGGLAATVQVRVASGHAEFQLRSDPLGRVALQRLHAR